MAKKKGKDDGNERAIDVESLPHDLKVDARDLGFRQRVSINKIARGVEHERKVEGMSWGFTGFMGFVAVVFFGWRFFAPEERKGQLLLVSLFAAAWSFLSWITARRAHKRQREFRELDAYVKEKLGH